MSHEKLPVLVVGAGPTGLTVANLLGLYGVRTVVVEARASVNRLPRATFVDDEFFRLLDTIGLADLVRRQSVSPAIYESYSPLGFLLSREEGQITSHNFPTRSAIFQPWLDQTLLDGLARFDHVDVLFDHEVIHHESAGKGVRVTLRTANGEQVDRVFSHVLAADGARSKLRDAAGFELEVIAEAAGNSLRVDVEGDPDKTPVTRFRPSFDRHASSFPAPNGRRYGFSVKPGEDLESLMSEASLARLLAPFREFKNVRVIRAAIYTFRSAVAREFRRGRIFLLGDAAHTQPPSGSQGMNGGARDANALAWRLALVHRGLADETFLDTYQLERHPAARNAVIAANQSMRRHTGTVGRIVHDVRSKLLDILHWRDPVEKTLKRAWHVETGLRTEIRDGLLVGKPERDTGRQLGRVLPNPWVELDGRPKLLDELLGTGFALVGVGSGAVQPVGISHPLWAGLGARRVVLQRDAALIESADSDVIVGRIADDRFDAVWAAYEGKWLVVRPDRIVAAIAESGQLHGVAEDLGAQLGRRPALSAAA